MRSRAGRRSRGPPGSSAGDGPGRAQRPPAGPERRRMGDRPGEEQHRDAIVGDPIRAELEGRPGGREVMTDRRPADHRHARGQRPDHRIEGALRVDREPLGQDDADPRLSLGRGHRLARRRAARRIDVDAEAGAHPGRDVHGVRREHGERDRVLQVAVDRGDLGGGGRAHHGRGREGRGHRRQDRRVEAVERREEDPGLRRQPAERRPALVDGCRDRLQTGRHRRPDRRPS